MSPLPASQHSLIRSLGRRLAAGLVGGVSAALLLSLLDWWLMLRQGSQGLDGESAAALCYAFLLLGAAGGCAGAGLSLAAAAGEMGLGRIRVRLSSLHALNGRIIGACCLGGGGALLVRFGWMPHWYRSGASGPGPGGGAIIALLAVLALLTVVLPVAVGRRWPHLCPGFSEAGPGRRTAIAALCLTLLYAGAAAGWSLGRPESEGSGRTVRTVPAHSAAGRSGVPGGPPVVVLLMDTLRWDSLSCYGNAESLTPNLDRFCRESVQFEVVRAQASWTKPSIATLLTSTHPVEHGARGRADRIRPSVPSLAGVFRRAGYRTGAVVANGNISPAYGFARGFDEYRYLRPEFCLGARGRALGLGSYRIASAAWQLAARGHRDHRLFKRDAAEVNREILDWLGSLTAEERNGIFLFVNYVDAHDPYFRHPYDGRALGAVDGKAPPVRVRDDMASLYNGEVAFLDRHLGQLFAHLRRLGLYERSLIVVTSDHGEEFLDHGGWWHGLTLYEEQVRVPLLVRLPRGANGGRRAGGEAGLIDVAPSLLELAGLGASTPVSMTGLSLAGLVADSSPGGGNGSRPFQADEVLDGNVLASLTDGRWKYVRANPDNPRGLPREALYDIKSDPWERTNLAGANPGLLADMSGRLDRLRGGEKEAEQAAPAAVLDEETAEHLRALGYLR